MEIEVGKLPEDREKTWREIILPNEQRRGEDLYRAGITRAAEAIMKSLTGGKCGTCGAEFERVEVDNLFAKFYYYRPSCNCYPVCQWCGTTFVEETDQGLTVKICPNCRMDPKGSPMYYQKKVPEK